jgi:hypothetical protein
MIMLFYYHVILADHDIIILSKLLYHERDDF